MADKFCLKMPDFHVTYRDLLHDVNLRHGTDGFTSPPKEGVLRIFSPWIIRRLRSGFNPRTWVPKASTLSLDHRSRCVYRLIWHSNDCRFTSANSDKLLFNFKCSKHWIRSAVGWGWHHAFCNYILYFPTKYTCTVKFFYCLLNICYTFRRSLRHPQEELFITSQNQLLIVTLLQWLSYSAWDIPYVGFFTKLFIIIKKPTYLLTPWSRVLLEKLTGFAANQEIPRILWNQKVHYRTHKRPPPIKK